MTAAVSSVTEGFCRERVMMIPTIAVAVMLCTVAGCCIYISYRIGQSISPASRVIQRRLSRVEAGVARSEATVERALDHHRHASSEQIARVLHESTERLTQLVESLRRPIDELHDRLNGMRLDLSRESKDLREDVEHALRATRDGAREFAGQLARVQAETTERIAGQLRVFGADDERRHDGTRTLLERTVAELSGGHAASVSEARSALAVRDRSARDRGKHRSAHGEHGAQLGRKAEEVQAALGSGEQRSRL
jgi:hypothetical protein